MSDLETNANTYKEIKNMKSCAFTGHRPQNLPFGFREDDERCTALKKILKKQIISLIGTK